MACHEIAGLRLGLMRVLGRDNESERQHELAELGTAAEQPGPVKSMCAAQDLASLKRFYEAALVALDERVARAKPTDPDLPYLRTLVVLTKKVDLDLRRQIEGLSGLYQDIEEMHDFVHEMYPNE